MSATGSDAADRGDGGIDSRFSGEYLTGSGAAEVIATVAARPAPMMSATAGLQL